MGCSLNTILVHGDCLERMKAIPANTIDAVVTDPPYGLSFMGKAWDYDVPSVEIWKEVLRVLKPGGHLLSFGGTRTYHRMVVAIEDAGFEIRDQLQWLYGQGFPKSLDISKAIDKAAGAEREVIGERKLTGTARIKGGQGGASSGRSAELYEKKEMRDMLQLTAPATEAAKHWAGWGTALKPANEPICLARKPISENTVADNVLKWGTGGLNIDGCRIPGAESTKRNMGRASIWGVDASGAIGGSDSGRFPANILLDDVAAEMLDEQSGTLKSGKLKGNYSSMGYHGGAKGHDKDYSPNDGGASRFFYVAKASSAERNAGLEGMPDRASPKFDGGDFMRGEGNNAKNQTAKNHHPTVKPVKLMEYLCRLITPPGGRVLDPFMGSGSTGLAAQRLGLKFVGIERDEEFYKIAQARMGQEG